VKFSSGSIGGLIGAVFLVAGCASVGETKFYTLSVPAEVREKDSYREHSVTPIIIDVMPVTVPERLARPQLVVSIKGQETQLLILEQARWSSHFNHELRDALARVIAEKVGAINEIRGSRAPAHLAYQPVYRIAIELSQFDATVGGRVNARFDWTIIHSTQARSAACYSAISESAGDSIESLVKGIQHVVAAVAGRIAANLAELNSRGAADCGSSDRL
jgi:uncharacterized lipoprotein YmbA